MALEGQAPADAAGIGVNGKDKWMELLKRSLECWPSTARYVDIITLKKELFLCRHGLSSIMSLRKLFGKRKTAKPALTIEEQVADLYNRNPAVFDRLAEL